LDKLEYKNKSYSSAPVSLVSAELIKRHNPKSLDRAKNLINSETKKLKCGDVIFSDKHKEIENDNLSGEMDLEILKKYKPIGLTRLEFQFFLAIFDIFISEYNKNKSLKNPIYLTLKDFHNKVLGINNRIRSVDINKYIDTFDNLSNMIITIDTSTVVRKKRRKLFIHGPVASINIVSIPEEKFYGLEIYPTSYLKYECINSKHISNHLPRDFIQLDMRENDNVLFFGYHLVRMHKINKRDELSCYWETTLNRLINNAIPYPEYFLKKYNDTRQKTQFLKRQLLDPLTSALKILSENGYVLDYEISKINSRKFLYDETKLSLIFNYDKSKFKNSLEIE
jgi:hypothetical protein